MPISVLSSPLANPSSWVIKGSIVMASSMTYYCPNRASIGYLFCIARLADSVSIVGDSFCAIWCLYGRWQSFHSPIERHFICNSIHLPGWKYPSVVLCRSELHDEIDKVSCFRCLEIGDFRAKLSLVQFPPPSSISSLSTLLSPVSSQEKLNHGKFGGY